MVIASAKLRRVRIWFLRLREVPSYIGGYIRELATAVWPLTVALLLGVMFLIWVKPGINHPAIADPNSPNTLYLLSAIAQALAAILALVFTIVLIVAQLSSAYSSRMIAGFFDRATIAYIALFVAAIFLPLWFLTNPTPNAVRICLTLTSACLLFLLPYFLSFRERLNPEVLLERLYERAKIYVGARHEPDEVRAIDNALMTAVARRDYDTFRHGASLLSNLVLDAYSGKDDFLGHCVLSRLGDIGVALISDPFLAKEITGSLQWIGLEALKRGWLAELGKPGDVLIMATLRIRDIGIKAVEQRQGEVLEAAIGCLEAIATEACRCDVKHIAQQALAILRHLGTMACEWGLADKAVLAGLTASLVGKIASEGKPPERPDDVATIRAGAFITIPVPKAPVLAAPTHLEGRGGIAVAAIEVLRELAWVLRNTGRTESVEEITGWLSEIAETAKKNGMSEIADYAARSVAELRSG